MFIDDNTSATNQFTCWLHAMPSAEVVVEGLCHDAQVWERLLFTSGGLLKLRKCLFYVMYWEFDSEGRPSLCLSSVAKPINQYDCAKKAYKYLGLWNSPTLSMAANLQELTGKAQAYSTRLFKSGLTTYEVWLAYFACFVSAMVFTFAVCSFTMQQLINLKKTPIRATLARLGINRNISRDIVFGSTLYGGLGLLDLFVEQGIAQLQLLLSSLPWCYVPLRDHRRRWPHVVT
jgi:hypothetical protein